jgi:glycerol-3-phosphate dehydrogenase
LLILDFYRHFGKNGTQDHDQDQGQDHDQIENRNLYHLLHAEVKYSIEYEMATKAVDFLVRRTGWVYFNRLRAEQVSETVVSFMGEVYGWGEIRCKQEIAAVKAEIEAIKQLPLTDDTTAKVVTH